MINIYIFINKAFTAREIERTERERRYRAPLEKRTVQEREREKRKGKENGRETTEKKEIEKRKR